MAEPLADQIVQQIGHVGENYYRLLVVAGLSGTGKTVALREVHARTGVPLINVNLDLSRRMLDLTERQRALHLPRLLGEIVGAVETSVVLVDNIEILFDISLKQNPLRLLQNLSRNKTLVVAWNGAVSGGQIIYAAPDHLEYRRYPVRDFLVVSPDLSAQQ
jgi:type II secretory pathway predicted ATPase ExeA